MYVRNILRYMLMYIFVICIYTRTWSVYLVCVHDISSPINRMCVCISVNTVHRLVGAYSHSILCGCGSGCGLSGDMLHLLAVSVLRKMQGRLLSEQRLRHVDLYSASPALHAGALVRLTLCMTRVFVQCIYTVSINHTSLGCKHPCIIQA